MGTPVSEERVQLIIAARASGDEAAVRGAEMWSADYELAEADRRAAGDGEE